MEHAPHPLNQTHRVLRAERALARTERHAILSVLLLLPPLILIISLLALATVKSHPLTEPLTIEPTCESTCDDIAPETEIRSANL